MPLGGYCTVCQRWVWLTPYGECQNGHPALAVKDVQQLKPQADPDLLVGEVLEEGKPRARFRWWWLHSAWILWMFSLGFMNWLGFVYIGVRARHTPWTLFGFAYLVPLLLTITAVATALPVWPFLLLQLADLAEALGAERGRALLGLADDLLRARRGVALELVAALPDLVERGRQLRLALAEGLDAAVQLGDLRLHRVGAGARRLELLLQLLLGERRACDRELHVALAVAAKPGPAECSVVRHGYRVDP